MTVAIENPSPPLQPNYWERFRIYRPGSCSVYGFGPEAKAFLEILGRDGVRGNSRYLRKTQYHAVMLDNEEDSLRFCKEALALVTQEPIVLLLESTRNFHPPRENIRAISLTEIAATLFWKKYPAKPDEKVAFIGKDPLVSTLLYQSLCQNLYSPTQKIQYHVWGKTQTTGLLHGLDQAQCTQYQIWEKSHATHPMQIAKDTIVFNMMQSLEQDWRMLVSMDRIILCDDEESNGRILQSLFKSGCPPVYIYGEERAPSMVRKSRASAPKHSAAFSSTPSYAPSFLSGGAVAQGLTFIQYPVGTHFGVQKDILSREIVLQEALQQEAKVLCSFEQQQYGGKPWNALSPFEREEIEVAARYFPVLRRLFKAGIPLESLAELEHLRWCRFYYLLPSAAASISNPFDDEPLDSRLVSYARLPEEYKQKARDRVMLALSQTP